jgi:hypothetical protein
MEISQLLDGTLLVLVHIGWKMMVDIITEPMFALTKTVFMASEMEKILLKT